jgi:hypothetical protein
LHQQRHQEVARQSAGQLIETQARAGRIGRLFIDIQDIFPAGDVRTIRLTNTPGFVQPRLKFVFLRNG